MSYLITLLAITLVVGVHEGGHYFFARLFNVRVLQFSLGFGPSLLQHKSKSGTRFILRLIPFGGYIQMLSKLENPTEKEEIYSFEHQNKKKRALILIGGVLANFLFAWLVFSGVTYFNNQTLGTKIKSVQKDSPAEKVGIHPNDTILALNGHNTPTLEEFFTYFSKQSTSHVQIKVERRGTHIVFDVPLLTQKIKSGTKLPFRLGVRFSGEKSNQIKIEHSFLTSLKKGAVLLLTMSAHFFKALGNLFSGSGFKNIHGPVGLLVETEKSYQEDGFLVFIFTLGFFSLQLGLFNLLPLPLLDGSKVALIALEFFRKKPLSLESERKLTQIGFLLLLGLFFLGMFNDIWN